MKTLYLYLVKIFYAVSVLLTYSYEFDESFSVKLKNVGQTRWWGLAREAVTDHKAKFENLLVIKKSRKFN